MLSSSDISPVSSSISPASSSPSSSSNTPTPSTVMVQLDIVKHIVVNNLNILEERVGSLLIKEGPSEGKLGSIYFKLDSSKGTEEKEIKLADLHRISDVFLGKQTPALSAPKFKGIASSDCFSITLNKGEQFNFVTLSHSDRGKFLSCLQSQFAKAKKPVTNVKAVKNEIGNSTVPAAPSSDPAPGATVNTLDTVAIPASNKDASSTAADSSTTPQPAPLTIPAQASDPIPVVVKSSTAAAPAAIKSTKDDIEFKDVKIQRLVTKDNQTVLEEQIGTVIIKPYGAKLGSLHFMAKDADADEFLCVIHRITDVWVGRKTPAQLSADFPEQDKLKCCAIEFKGQTQPINLVMPSKEVRDDFLNAVKKQFGQKHIVDNLAPPSNTAVLTPPPAAVPEPTVNATIINQPTPAPVVLVSPAPSPSAAPLSSSSLVAPTVAPSTPAKVPGSAFKTLAGKQSGSTPALTVSPTLAPSVVPTSASSSSAPTVAPTISAVTPAPAFKVTVIKQSNPAPLAKVNPALSPSPAPTSASRSSATAAASSATSTPAPQPASSSSPALSPLVPPAQPNLAALFDRQEKLGFWAKLWRAIQGAAVALYSLLTTCSMKAYHQWQNRQMPIVKISIPSATYNTIELYRSGLNSPRIEKEGELLAPNQVQGKNIDSIFMDRGREKRFDFYRSRLQDSIGTPLTDKEKAALLKSKNESLEIAAQIRGNKK